MGVLEEVNKCREKVIGFREEISRREDRPFQSGTNLIRLVHCTTFILRIVNSYCDIVCFEHDADET